MTNKPPALSSIIVLGLSLLMLSACGGEGNVNPDSIQLDSARDLGESVAAENAAQSPTLLSDPVTFDPFELYPAIVELEQHESSGLLLGYTDASQLDNPDLEYINEAWVSMQDCLGVSADAPLVVIQQSSVEPLASTDDIVFDFQGRISASAHDGETGASLQVLASEVAETFVDQGFSLRSIMGRYLWRNNSLPERDYPFSCAATSF